MLKVSPFHQTVKKLYRELRIKAESWPKKRIPIRPIALPQSSYTSGPCVWWYHLETLRMRDQWEKKTNPRPKKNQKPKANKQTQVNHTQGMRNKRTWGCKSGGARAAASESSRNTKTQREREDWGWRYWTLKGAKAEGRRRPLLLLQNAIRVRVRS